MELPGQTEMFPMPNVQRGPIATAFEETLAYWQSIGHLKGPEYAATRAILRQNARLADAAMIAVDHGERSEYSAANVVKLFRYAMEQHAPVSQPEEPATPSSDDDAVLSAAAEIIAKAPLFEDGNR